MTLVVQWFFVPFGTRGRVLYSLSGNHPQCPIIQMTDTEDPGQSWVCDDSCRHPSWFKDRHSSQFYLILSASSVSSKIWLWALPPVFPPSLGFCPDKQVKTLVSFPPSSCYLLFGVCRTLLLLFVFFKEFARLLVLAILLASLKLEFARL